MASSSLSSMYAFQDVAVAARIPRAGEDAGGGTRTPDTRIMIPRLIRGSRAASRAASTSCGYPTRAYQPDRASRTPPGDRHHDQQKGPQTRAFRAAYLT